LNKLSNEELSELVEISRALGYDSVGSMEEFFVKPRGYRQLVHVPRLPGRVAEKLIEEFGTLKELLDATEEDLDDVEGVGQARARAIRRNLKRQRNLETTGEML
jgi:diadenylate cyclase